MKIGVPTEIKPQEERVALTPAGAERLISAGHAVSVQTGAGRGSGFDDADYEAAGARIAADAPTVFADSDMILKVKEPLATEWPLIRAGQTVFTYLHLAASRELTEALIATGGHHFAYETLEVDGQLPLLTPSLDEQPLRESAAEFEERISKLVASDAELSEYVRQLKKREFAN